jgi:hypothetical protein
LRETGHACIFAESASAVNTTMPSSKRDLPPSLALWCNTSQQDAQASVEV